MDLHFIRNARVILDINLGKEGKEGEPQKRQDAPPFVKKKKPPEGQQESRYEGFFFCSFAQEREERKRGSCAQNNKHAKTKRNYSPEDTLDLHFLFLSHVKGFIRGSAPVRRRVSMDRADALFAFVRAPAGLSDPDTRTMFCIVRLFSIS